MKSLLQNNKYNLFQQQMPSHKKQIADLLNGPAFPDKEFISSGVTFGEVYALAAGFRAALSSPEYQGVSICLAVEDKAVLAAVLLAALHPSLERAALGRPCPSAALHPSLERAALGRPCPSAALAADKKKNGATLLLPFAFSVQALARMQELTGYTAAITDRDRNLPAGITIISPQSGKIEDLKTNVAVAPQTEILKIFTGGSTGFPQIWSKTAANLFGEGFSLARQFGITGNDVIVATVPPYHIYGLLFSVILPLVSGSCVVAETPSFPGEIVETIEKQQATLLAAIPPHYRVLREKKVASSLRLAFSSAGMLDQQDNTLFCQRNQITIIEVYGSTETGGIATRNRSQGETAFTAFPEVSWQISEDRLCVRSPWLSPDLPVDRHGFFITGDRVRTEGSSQFLLQGRMDGVTKVGGKRVDLAEIQNHIKQMPKVSDCVVLALAQSGGREHQIAALIQGIEADIEHIRKTLADALEPYAVPRLMKVVAKIPLSASGKQDREAILRYFES
jgi:acyl-coenzyme A synthetase/AMP-(fatty) acid ligase